MRVLELDEFAFLVDAVLWALTTVNGIILSYRPRSGRCPPNP